jgi:hypothetical protein
MADMSDVRSSPGFWALTLGAVGGCAGFFGPILLNPEANQGPLLGIFITGPGGALAGLVLGFIFRMLPLTPAIRAQALTLCAVALGAGTLWSSLPGPQHVASIVDGTISGCRLAGEVAHERVAHWDRQIAKYDYAEPRPGWRDDVPRMVRESPGIVVTLDVERGNQLYELRRPWRRELSASGWQDINEPREYFGSDSCASYPQGRRMSLAPRANAHDVIKATQRAWPPADLPNFLGVQMLEAVPPEYARLVAGLTTR